jgi:hypothetical protein
VRFDDRLLTVLKQPAGDRHDVAVRWRQLVDLVARAGPNSSSPVVAQALETIRSDTPRVDENLRAAAARAVAALPLPRALLEAFAADRLSVSAPVLAAASLEPLEWQALLAVGDQETRRFIETLHPEQAAQPAARPEGKVEVGPFLAEAKHDEDLTATLTELAQALQPAADQVPPPPPPGPSLSEVVARIERRRRSRELHRPSPEAAPVPMSSAAPALFRWECNPSGEIAWVEGAPRGALIGRSIARPQEQGEGGVDDEVVRAFTLRAPFRDRSLSVAGDGLVAGDWRISGVPAFEPNDGRFAGYRGVALRENPPVAAAAVEPPEYLPDPDSVRELVHEIKTPLNAIIGFAEIIDGQYLGPADRRYRERAATIVAQAQLLLSAIDDLDFAAKIHSADGSGRRVDLRELIERIAGSLRELADERGTTIEIVKTPRTAPAAIEPELADRLIYRLCSAVIGLSERGDRLRLSLDQTSEQCSFSVSRPSALRGMSDVQLFDPSSVSAAEASSAAFSLRLVRGLARIAGGDLTTSQAGLTLQFPRT